MAHPNIHQQGDGSIVVGERTRIGEHLTVIFHAPGTVTIGDYCTIGSSVKIICNGGDVTIGDWTSLHDGCLLMSTGGLQIGDHGWFGQFTVLDGTGGLRIGNGVRVGMYSQLWSHVAAGEQIEGCTLFGTRPVVIEDDVWLVGSCIVASGVTIGRRTVALIGSNITKSHPENVTLAGSPAQPKSGLTFYKPIEMDEKWCLLCAWLKELAVEADLRFEYTESSMCLSDHAAPTGEGAQHIFFTRTKQQALALIGEWPRASVCVLEDKSYNKTHSPLEQKVLKYLAGNKARFFAANWA